SAEASPVSITVYQGPTIVTQPASQSRLVGQPAVLSVSVSGGEPLSFQWEFNGSLIPGATSPALFIPSLALSDAGTYSVIVGNPFGTIGRDPAALDILAPVSITTQPIGA